MWIRSQNNELVECGRITPFGKRVMTKKDGDEITLGTYPTEARALEVLDEIQDYISQQEITGRMYFSSKPDPVVLQVVFEPYQMPEK